MPEVSLLLGPRDRDFFQPERAHGGLMPQAEEWLERFGYATSDLLP